MGGKGPNIGKIGTQLGRLTPIGAIGGYMNDNAKRAANAAQAAALAQQQEAQRQARTIGGITDQATASGIASFEQDIKRQEKNLSRQEQLISQIDPTVIEASQQALRLLRGEQSSTLAPIQQQRDMQRQKLLNSLREQLGPGAETSTAGIQALTRFDSETNSLMSGAQQQALSGLGGIAGQFNSIRPDMFRDIMGLSQLGQGKSNLLFNQASIFQNSNRPLLDTAGAQFTGDTVKANQGIALQNQLIGGGITAGTALLTSGFGRASPNPTVNTPGVPATAANYGAANPWTIA